MTDPVLSVRDVRTHFRTEAGVVRAVDGIDFDVMPGEVLAMVGESGSGKSVTGLTIMGLLPRPSASVESGEIRWKGRDLLGLSPHEMRKVRGNEIAMIFQDPMTALNPVFTVGAQIVEMIRLHNAVNRRQARTRAVAMLEAVGIPQPDKRFDMYPHELSGGMRQRAMIAMSIACDPELIIADEPTTALDVTVQAQVLDVLAEMRERTGASLLLITHDLGVVAGVADRVLVMYAGHVVETGGVDEIFYRTRHPYTLGLLASLPRTDDDVQAVRLRPIAGHPPSLVHLPPGCPFHPRCDVAELPHPCSTETPPLRVVDGHQHRSACHFAERLADVDAEGLRLEYARTVDRPHGEPVPGSARPAVAPSGSDGGPVADVAPAPEAS